MIKLSINFPSKKDLLSFSCKGRSYVSYMFETTVYPRSYPLSILSIFYFNHFLFTLNSIVKTSESEKNVTKVTESSIFDLKTRLFSY